MSPGNQPIVSVIAGFLFLYAGHSPDAREVRGLVGAPAAERQFLLVAAIEDWERLASRCRTRVFLLYRQVLGDKGHY